MKSSSHRNNIEDFQSHKFLQIEPKLKTPREAKTKNLESKNLDLGVKDLGVKDLNDNIFVITGDFISDLMGIMISDRNRNPTFAEFSDVILTALQQSDKDLFLDVEPQKISGIKLKSDKRKKISGKPGDIIAIPANNNAFFLACILAKNVFGTAYGLFEGTFQLTPNVFHKYPKTLKYPIYSGDEFVASGRWKIVGRDEKILALFPDEPEIYHAKQIVDVGIPIGLYGSGETASGKMRDLTKEEAEEIGLLSNSYQQVLLEEELEDYLNKKIETMAYAIH
ncbi:MAG: hypothetical protein J7647_11020 [Cyanobacteria bacterium SBLK]|nr:hypothetical protein [Cyanobacteria bacterium SBLK]